PRLHEQRVDLAAAGEPMMRAACFCCSVLAALAVACSSGDRSKLGTDEPFRVTTDPKTGPPAQFIEGRLPGSSPPPATQPGAGGASGSGGAANAGGAMPARVDRRAKVIDFAPSVRVHAQGQGSLHVTG